MGIGRDKTIRTKGLGTEWGRALFSAPGSCAAASSTNRRIHSPGCIDGSRSIVWSATMLAKSETGGVFDMPSLNELLARAGEMLPARAVRSLSRTVDLIGTGNWVTAQGFQGFERHDRREGVYQAIIERVADQSALYLEFGVFQGAATRWWAQRMTNPNTVMIGFDTFEGLPENWQTFEQGHFSVGGQLPQINDARVSFQKGLFSDTLPATELPQRDVLVLNMDADLYDGTAYALRFLEDRIQVGTFIYFDEFNDLDNEFRAFTEMVERTGYKFDMIAATKAFRHVAFKRVQ